MINIDIITKSKRWNKLPSIENYITKTCTKLINLTEINNFAKNKNNYLELSISLVSNAQIKKINNNFRNKNKPTNVLSFPSLDGKLLRQIGFNNFVKDKQNLFLGDIIIALEMVENEALESHKNFYDHLTHLILHSILHLIGYDHENKIDAEIMENLEIEILNKINIKNPYLTL